MRRVNPSLRAEAEGLPLITRGEAGGLEASLGGGWGVGVVDGVGFDGVGVWFEAEAGAVFEGFPLSVFGPGDFGEEDGPGFHFAAEDFDDFEVGRGHGAVEVEEGVGVGCDGQVV